MSCVENIQKINKRGWGGGEGDGGRRLIETWEYSNSKVILLPSYSSYFFLHSN